MDGTPGWYGKLPSLGDFASRRLPVDFVEVWDAWLAQGLSQWRESDAAWLDAYLAAPAWCFVLGPRLLGTRRRAAKAMPVWAGILMPSVDRVGRYFPLTVASPFPTLDAAVAPRLAHWLRQTAALAIAALHEDWSPERFDEALFGLADLTWPLAPPDAALAPLGDALERIARDGDGALWWLPMNEGDLGLQRTPGLPTGSAFARLLSGRPVEPAAL